MKRKRFITLLALIVAVVLVSGQMALAVTVTVTDPSPTFTAKKYNCCPEGCPMCIVTADYPTASDEIADMVFGEAWDNWNNEPGNPKGWGLVDGGVLNGFFDITTYDAGFDGCCGGVEIWISYIPGAGDPDPDDVAWSQAIFTNKKKEGVAGPGNPYLDIIVDENPDTWEPPVYPYQYEDAWFYDFPCRNCPSVCEEATFWEGYAYLTAVDYALHQLTVYEGVVWGFEIECVVPEPATVALFSLGSLALLRRRRR